MSDEPTEYDEAHPSQAEGEDPSAPEPTIVLPAEGKPSSAEGEDLEDTAPIHEVLDPSDP